MKNIIRALFVLSFINGIYAGYIEVSPTDLGSGKWEYAYQITASEEAIEGVTIWFDYYDYENFEITTEDPGGWSQSIIPPEDWLKQGAGFNIYNWDSPLPAGDTSQQYTIKFDYTGTEAPTVHQDYDILNSDCQVVDTGTTVPEPATFAFLALSAAALRLRSKKRIAQR